jgi:uncharacterized protein YbgA (DUF1722 family)
MHEKSRRLSVTCRTQPSTRVIATAEIDLGRILNRNNPPPLTALSRPYAQRLDDLTRRHRTRRHKAVRSHLTGSIAADLAKHQRAGSDDPIK